MFVRNTVIVSIHIHGVAMLIQPPNEVHKPRIAGYKQLPQA
jgi:hypothetical protein